MDPSRQRTEILRYANRHGLFKSIQDDSKFRDACASLATGLLNSGTDIDATCPSLSELCGSGGSNLFPEKLDLSVKGREMLYDVMTSIDLTVNNDGKDEAPRLIRAEKLETPMLQNDISTELHQMRTRVRQQIDSPLPLLPWPLDVEKDESLEWPSTLRSLPDKIDQRLRHEKLDIGKGSMAAIRSVLSLMLHDDHGDGSPADDSPPQVASLLPKQSTPLLSPSKLADETIYNEFEAPRSRGSEREIDTLSKDHPAMHEAHSGLTKNRDDSGALPIVTTPEAESSKQDLSLCETSNLSYNAPNSCFATQSSPLKSQHLHASPASKGPVAPKNELGDILDVESGSQIERLADDEQVASPGPDTDLSDQDYDAVFQKLINSHMLDSPASKPQADLIVPKDAERNPRNAYLQVPSLSLEVGPAPWEAEVDAEASLAELQGLIGPVTSLSLHRRTGMAELEQTLSWAVPFPVDDTLAVMKGDSPLHGDVAGLIPDIAALEDDVRGFVADHGRPAKCLFNKENEEELAHRFPPPDNYSSGSSSASSAPGSSGARGYSNSQTAKRRKIDIDSFFAPAATTSTPDFNPTHSFKARTKINQLADNPTERRPLTPLKSFDISEEINRFVSLSSRRSATKPRNPYKMPAKAPADPPANKPTPGAPPEQQTPNKVSQLTLSRTPTLLNPPPSPTLVLAPSMFANHALVRTLHRLAPSATLTEQEPPPVTTMPRQPASERSRFFPPARQVAAPSHAQPRPVRADVEFASRCGVVLTTLAHTLQRPLPGSRGGDTPLQEARVRALAVSGAYRALHVLVRVPGAAEAGCVIVGERERAGFEGLGRVARGLRGICEVVVRAVSDVEGDVAVWILDMADGVRE